MERMTQGTAAPPIPGVGGLLRQWRTTRGWSQLDLALRAGFSARHLSFIETGRSRPSRDALLVLAQALEVPLRERNRLLEAGGFAAAFRHTPLSADDMGHIRGVLRFILERHEPYGAVVLDRLGTLVMANEPATRLLSGLIDPTLLGPGANLLRAVFHPRGLRTAIVNWDDVARYLLSRAEHELAGAADDRTAADLLAEVRGYAGPLAQPAAPGPISADLLLPVHLRTPAGDLRLFTTIMTLGTPRDVTLQELRLETFFPADADSETRLGTWLAGSR